jgi:hypothetical protein
MSLLSISQTLLLHSTRVNRSSSSSGLTPNFAPSLHSLGALETRYGALRPVWRHLRHRAALAYPPGTAATPRLAPAARFLILLRRRASVLDLALARSHITLTLTLVAKAALTGWTHRQLWSLNLPSTSPPLSSATQRHHMLALATAPRVDRPLQPMRWDGRGHSQRARPARGQTVGCPSLAPRRRLVCLPGSSLARPLQLMAPFQPQVIRLARMTRAHPAAFPQPNHDATISSRAVAAR